MEAPNDKMLKALQKHAETIVPGDLQLGMNHLINYAIEGKRRDEKIKEFGRLFFELFDPSSEGYPENP